MKSKIAVLLTCHNRCQKTINCLNNLFDSNIPDNYKLDVFLVDDGCTDETAVYVRNFFPHVFIIPGDGTLFWNRGMRKAWEYALEHDNYSYFLWLNDDTMIEKSALKVLADESQKHYGAIIVGTTCSTDNRDVYTYGGYCQKNILVKPTDASLPCRFFNGNLVLIPNSVVQKIGILDRRFQHSFGDFEYGLRAAKKNIEMYSTPIVGTCDRNPLYTKWTDKKYNVWERLRLLYSPLGKNPCETFIVESYFSYPKAFIVFFYLHLKAIFPQFFPDRSVLN